MSFLGELRSALGMKNPENTYHLSQSQSAPSQSIWQQDAQNYEDIQSLDDIDGYKQFYLQTDWGRNNSPLTPVMIGYKNGKIASARFGDGDTVWGRDGLARLFGDNLSADEHSYVVYETPTPYQRNGSYYNPNDRFHEYKERQRYSDTPASATEWGAYGGGNDKHQVIPSALFGYGFDKLEPNYGL